MSEPPERHLTAEDLLLVSERVVGADAVVRDIGLLEAAAARPRATVFGAPAYPTLFERAAALLHSLVRNHALLDGNKRLGLAAVIVTLRINGWRLTLSNDEAYDLVMSVATGDLDDVDSIGRRLREGSERLP